MSARAKLLLALAALSLLLQPASLSASYVDNPPPLAGWMHAPFLPDSPQHHGIVLSGGHVVRGSPVVAEMDGNSADGKEAAVAGSDGRLYVYKANGQLLWSTDVLPVGCTAGANDFKINSSPAVGALYGDGVPYVVASYGTLTPSDCDGGIAVYRGSNGGLVWRFSLRAWQASQGYPPEEGYGVIASPALADTDGNGRLEIGFGGLDRNIYLLNADGTVRWYYNAADAVWSTPAFADVNGDGRLDMLIGTPISANPVLNPPTFDGGYLYAFDTAPRNPTRIEFCNGTCAGSSYRWQVWFDQVIFSSPAVGDALPTSTGLEVVIGNGCVFPSNSSNKNGKWLKILRASDGTLLQTLNLPTGATCVQSSPALGDLDDDGKLDVVATLNGASDYGGDGYGRIAAWRPAVSSNPYWAMIPTNANVGANDPYIGDIQSPVIADVDGNGSLEVMAANTWDVIVVNGRTGAQLTCGGSTCGMTPSLFAWYTLKSTPALGDLDGNGALEVLIGGGHNFGGSNGYFYAWTGLAGMIGSPTGMQPTTSAPWPMFHGNAQHTGIAQIAAPAVVPNQVNSLLARGQSRAYPITFNSYYGGVTSWHATENDPLGIVSLSQTVSTSTNVLTVTVTAPQMAGVYNASVQVEFSDMSTATVPISVNVLAQTHTLYLPLVRR